MATLTNDINCLVCSSLLPPTENKVNKLDVLFLLRILLEIPEDSQLTNNIKLRLNLIKICDQCGSTIKHCRQIYQKISKQIETFWECQNKILDKFSDLSPQNILPAEDETSDKTFYNCWVNQCRKFVKDHDISGFGYPFIVQDLETLIVSLPQSQPPPLQILSSTDIPNFKKETHESNNDNEEDTDSFNYDPPDIFDGISDNDNESDYSPSPSKKAKTSIKFPDDGDGSGNNEKQVEGTVATKELQIRLNRLTTGHFNCNWPGCNGKVFKIKECWEDHMDTHKLQNPEDCKSSTDKPIITPQTYLCVWPDCNEGKGKEFRVKETWEVHMDRHMKTPKKKCDKCGFLFYSKDQLNFHVKLEHGKRRKRRRPPKEDVLNEEELEPEKKEDDKDEDYEVGVVDYDEDDPLSDNSDSDLKSSRKVKGKAKKIYKDKETKKKANFHCTWPGCNDGKGKIFNTKTSLAIHMDKHEGTPKKNCTKCELLFYSYYELGVHMEVVHKIVKKKDGLKFKYNLNQDPVTGKYYCTWPQCEKIYSSLDLIKTHMDRHNGSPRRQCEECDKRFYSRSQLNRHKQKEHVGERNFRCEICGASYFILNDLAAHRSKVHSSSSKLRKWAICETCGKRMGSAHLSTHIRIVHDGDSTSKKYGCHLCPVRAEGEMKLKLHLMKTHQFWRDEEEREEIVRWAERKKELRRKWKCPVKKCRQGHLTEKGLMKHVEEKHGGDWGDGEGNVEGDVYAFRCEVCGKGFHHKGRFKEHAETHKGMEERERSFKCEICGRGFAKVGSLKKHVKTHGERERKWCEICKVGFLEEKVFQKHLEGKSHKLRMEMVEGGGRECEVCGKMFRTSGTLSQHRRKMHRNDKTVE